MNGRTIFKRARLLVLSKSEQKAHWLLEGLCNPYKRTGRVESTLWKCLETKEFLLYINTTVYKNRVFWRTLFLYSAYIEWKSVNIYQHQTDFKKVLIIWHWEEIPKANWLFVQGLLGGRWPGKRAVWYENRWVYDTGGRVFRDFLWNHLNLRCELIIIEV